MPVSDSCLCCSVWIESHLRYFPGVLIVGSEHMFCKMRVGEWQRNWNAANYAKSIAHIYLLHILLNFVKRIFFICSYPAGRFLRWCSNPVIHISINCLIPIKYIFISCVNAEEYISIKYRIPNKRVRIPTKHKLLSIIPIQTNPNLFESFQICLFLFANSSR